MLYQKLLSGTDPYFVELQQNESFEMHRHPEAELSYCFKGKYDIIINQNKYVLQEGDLAIVTPMTPHELCEDLNNNNLRLTIEIGPALLGEQFYPFISMDPSNCIFSLKSQQDKPIYNELRNLLNETAKILTQKRPFYNLIIKGNIYKISAELLTLLADNSEESKTVLKSLMDIEKIGNAINVIYSRYDEPLNLDMVSALCGYSTSSFCKMFKAITGESFHSMLNRHRIEVACLKLKEHNTSIEELALSVGFADSKSFCRVFKKITGKNTGEYVKVLKDEKGKEN